MFFINGPKDSTVDHAKIVLSVFCKWILLTKTLIQPLGTISGNVKISKDLNVPFWIIKEFLRNDPLLTNYLLVIFKRFLRKSIEK